MPFDRVNQAMLADNQNYMRKLLNARRAHHFQTVFFDESGTVSHSAEKVLADLNRFCRGNQSTFDANPQVHALLEGRREVLLRISNFLFVPAHELNKYVEVNDE